MDPLKLAEFAGIWGVCLGGACIGVVRGMTVPLEVMPKPYVVSACCSASCTDWSVTAFSSSTKASRRFLTTSLYSMHCCSMCLKIDVNTPMLSSCLPRSLNLLNFLWMSAKYFSTPSISNLYCWSSRFIGVFIAVMRLCFLLPPSSLRQIRLRSPTPFLRSTCCSIYRSAGLSDDTKVEYIAPLTGR